MCPIGIVEWGNGSIWIFATASLSIGWPRTSNKTFGSVRKWKFAKFNCFNDKSQSIRSKIGWSLLRRTTWKVSSDCKNFWFDENFFFNVIFFIISRLFPDYFYTFLQSYMQMFSSLQILPPDDKIMRLYSDIKQIIDIFLPSNNEQENRTIPDDDGLILITAVVTSCIRGLKYCKTKLHCLEILQQLSMYTTSETVLDRILPYIVSIGWID